MWSFDVSAVVSMIAMTVSILAASLSWYWKWYDRKVAVFKLFPARGLTVSHLQRVNAGSIPPNAKLLVAHVRNVGDATAYMFRAEIPGWHSAMLKPDRSSHLGFAPCEVEVFEPGAEFFFAAWNTSGQDMVVGAFRWFVSPVYREKEFGQGFVLDTEGCGESRVRPWRFFAHRFWGFMAYPYPSWRRPIVRLRFESFFVRAWLRRNGSMEFLGLTRTTGTGYRAFPDEVVRDKFPGRVQEPRPPRRGKRKRK